MFLVQPGVCGADGTLIVELSGELDVHERGRLEHVLQGLPEHVRLVLDLRGLEFVDSSGVRVVCDAHDRARDLGRDYLVVKPSNGVVTRVFEILGLDRTGWVVDGMPSI